MIYFGSLINYKNKKIKEQILVVLKIKEFKIEIYKFLKNEIDLVIKSGYYGLGIDDEKKDTELTLIEEIRVIDVLGLKVDKKIKNIVNFIIRDNENNDKKKGDDKIIPSFGIVIDFSSSSDSKNFILKFKDMSTEFKNQFKSHKK